MVLGPPLQRPRGHVTTRICRCGCNTACWSQPPLQPACAPSWPHTVNKHTNHTALTCTGASQWSALITGRGSTRLLHKCNRQNAGILRQTSLLCARDIHIRLPINTQHMDDRPVKQGVFCMLCLRTTSYHNSIAHTGSKASSMWPQHAAVGQLPQPAGGMHAAHNTQVDNQAANGSTYYKHIVYTPHDT